VKYDDARKRVDESRRREIGDAFMSEATYERCPQCNEPPIPGKPFCANCGAPLDSTAGHIRTLIDEALKIRFKDQQYVVLETSVAAADKLTKWLRLFLTWAGIPLALIAILLGILGFRTYSDFTSKVTAAESQVETVSAAAQRTAETAQQRASEVAKALDSITPGIESSQRALSELRRTATSLSGQYGQLQLDVSRYKQVNEKIEEVQKQLTAVQGQIIDIGKRELRAERFTATGPGPSGISFGRLGCPSFADLPKDNRQVTYCAQGAPPSLFQLTSTELRAVAGLSPAGFQDVSVAPKPTCDAASRGTFYVEKGTGAVPDKPFLCARKADSTYGWIQLGIVP
jgi:hypothetical protein